MTFTLSHPDDERLADYTRGLLDDEAAAAVDDHLSGCHRCCELLEHLPEDPFLALVRAADGDARLSGPDRAWTATFVPSLRPVPPSPEDAGLTGGGRPGDEAPLPDALTDHPRYRVVGLCGEGGMGAVYRAEHRLMRREVALKVISPAFMRRPAAVERFRREVRAAAQLSHPNIVAAYDAEQAGDLHLLVMELVEGRDLATVVAECGPLPLVEACDYARQAAMGLAHAHGLGMVHRDVKPHNLMVTPDGRVKILDFGLARFASEAAELADPSVYTAVACADLTHASTLLGTPDYVAPEQTRDAHAADVRADVYGLGCTLYFLLAGRPPFAGGSVPEKVRGHAERDPQPVSELRPDAPAGLAAVVGRMMAKDPADRYQTAAEVAEALRPFTGADPARRPPGRWAAVAALTATAAVLLAGVVLYLQTAKGTVRIEIDDPDIRVSLAGDTYTLENAGETIRVRPGEHSLLVRRGDLEFETPTFTLSRGQNPALRVELVRGAVVVKQGDAELSRRPAPVPAGPTAPADDTITHVRRVEGHSGKIEALQASRDGKWVLSADDRGRIIRWDATYFKAQRQWQAHPGMIREARFTPDARKVVSVGDDATLRVWEAGTGKELMRVDLLGKPRAGRTTVPALDVSPDGRHAAVFCGATQLGIFDLATGKKTAPFENRKYSLDVHYTRAGHLLTTDVDTIQLLDPTTGKNLWTRTLPDTREIELELSPDESRVVAGVLSGELYILDGADGRVLHRLAGHAVAARCFAFTADGRHLVTGGDDKVLRLWEVTAGKEVARGSAQSHCLNRLALMPDGKTVVTGGGGGYDPIAREYQSDSDRALHLWRLPERVWPKAPTAGAGGHIEPHVESAGRPPVRAVVERLDLTLKGGTIATVRVRVVDGTEWLKQGNRGAHLHITSETRLTRRCGQKTEPAGPESLKEGVTVEFMYTEIANSAPPHIVPTTVVVIEPAG